MPRSHIVVLALIAGALILGGCGYRPGGRGWQGSAHTWVSTEWQPATVTLVDTRTGEEMWTMDIPVGYQLTTRFIEGGGTDHLDYPDRLEYQIFLGSTPLGKLRSAIAVPPAAGRRWDVTYRPAPEMAEAGIRNDPLGFSPPLWERPKGDLPDLDKSTGYYRQP